MDTQLRETQYDSSVFLLCSIREFHKEYMNKLVVITVMKTDLAIKIRHGWTKDEDESVLKPKVANCGGGCGCGGGFSPATEKTRK